MMSTCARSALAVVAVLAVALVAAPGAAAQQPTCFGAPAMDPLLPCVDRLVTVTPRVEAVDDEAQTPCRRMRSPAALSVCAFGASESRAGLHLALIGDSHTFAWRAALQRIGRSEGWRGYSLATPACLFSAAARRLPAGSRERCAAVYRATLRWLRQHREIDVVITTHEADGVLDVAADTTRAVKIAGFRRTWRALPRTIKRVIVLRDTPNASREELDCVQRAEFALALGAARACAVPRSWTLTNDAAVQAARGLHAARHRVVDLTDLICSPDMCHPAVGGVLVNRDTTGHITQTFAQTTSPYLLARLRPLLAWGRTRR